ncbi:hypothetical protein CP973_33735 [Streptomyces albofaciens JCM 4342]|nr:hypothetical protein CP973_33735 [Streptomyces albofaciens JCM 4342]
MWPDRQDVIRRAVKPEKTILDVYFGPDATTPAIEEEFNLYTARAVGESIAMEYAARLHRAE